MKVNIIIRERAENGTQFSTSNLSFKFTSSCHDIAVGCVPFLAFLPPDFHRAIENNRSSPFGYYLKELHSDIIVEKNNTYFIKEQTSADLYLFYDTQPSLCDGLKGLPFLRGKISLDFKCTDMVVNFVPPRVHTLKL